MAEGVSYQFSPHIHAVNVLQDQIATHKDAIRDLKASDADKATIEAAVYELLAAQGQYDELIKQHPPAAASGSKEEALLDKITSLIKDSIKDLKAKKADNATIKAAVKKLLAAQRQHDELIKQDPPATPRQHDELVKQDPPTAVAGSKEKALLDKITSLKDSIKDKKADKATIKAAVYELLAAQRQHDELIKQDPPATPMQHDELVKQDPPTAVAGSKEKELLDKITSLKDSIKDLKAKKADKATIKAAIIKLLEAKKQYNDLTGL